ncbi:MAG: hypothetical protein II076_08220, partial [Bacteroidales bacterium]|nr:hypothetical protein [Bacteroidales bacterium]
AYNKFENTMHSNLLIMKKLNDIMRFKGDAQHNICGDVSGRCADSFGVFTNLMLNLMSVEI